VKPGNRQAGFALILVLWVLSLLTLMAGSFSLSMRRETAVVANIKNSARATAIAESGLVIAQYMLALPDKNLQWRADGSVYQIDTDEAEIRVRIQAEDGKVDINNADEALLTAVLAYAPVASSNPAHLASAILDWRDQDDLVRINGAEGKEYQEAGLKHLPRNKPFESIDELQLVLGMDRATFVWLMPLVTLYSGQARVNLVNASAEMLRVLPGLDQALVEEYLAARLRSSQQNLPPPPFPSAPGQAALGGASSPVVSVVSEVLLDDGTAARISAVLMVSQNTQSLFQVLDWRHDALGNLTLFADATANHSVASDWIAKHYVEPELNR